MWTVPASRMKAKREHRVPLSGRVLAVLAEAWMLTDESGLVFPNAKGRQLTRGALGRVLRRCGIDGTTHGFRSSFRDYCAETEVDRAVAEASLAHVVTGVEGAYFRSDLLQARRQVL